MDDIEQLIGDQIKGRQGKRFEKNVAKARAKDSMKAFNKLVREVDGRPRLVSDPPLVVPVHELFAGAEYQQVETGLRTVLKSYRRSLQGDHRHLLEGFEFVEAGRKVVGVGSVGTRAWIAFLLGNGDDDPLFLQAKEAEASVLEPFLGRSKHANHGQRVVEGQRLMQSTSDVLLGWARTDGVDGTQRDFYIRQLWDGKGSAVVELMKPSAMKTYARVCGWTLARAHARSGDAAAIAAYLGSGEGSTRLGRLRGELRGPERAGPRYAQACGGVRKNHGHRGLIPLEPLPPRLWRTGSVSPVFIEPSPLDWPRHACGRRPEPTVARMPRAAARAHVHRARPVATASSPCSLARPPMPPVLRANGSTPSRGGVDLLPLHSGRGPVLQRRAPASRASSAAQPTRRAARTA